MYFSLFNLINLYLVFMVKYFSHARILYMRELHNSYSSIQITKLYYEVKAKNIIGCTYKRKYFDFKNIQKCQFIIFCSSSRSQSLLSTLNHKYIPKHSSSFK